VHMGYDGKNKNMVNPNGKHQWCLWMQSMSKLKREEWQSWRQHSLKIDDYIHMNNAKKLGEEGFSMAWVGAVLNPSLHWINKFKRNKEHGVVEERTAWKIWEKFLVNVVNETKRGLTDSERVKGLPEVN
jgi:hypothetical protein